MAPRLNVKKRIDECRHESGRTLTEDLPGQHPASSRKRMSNDQIWRRAMRCLRPENLHAGEKNRKLNVSESSYMLKIMFSTAPNLPLHGHVITVRHLALR